MAQNIPNANRLAKLMHPKSQAMVITNVKDENSSMRTYTLKASDDHELAYFSAGAYIPVVVEIDGNKIERPYAICSSPKDSVKGIYEISVKRMDGGYVSNYIYENWTVGTEVTLGGPGLGDSYSPIRDKKHVIGIAGGIGVTPFRSMAKAIVEGDVDCELTLIYGANTMEDVVYKDEWKKLEEASNGKFKCVIVIANEEIEGCEHGFVSLDMINKYHDVNDASLFISGPAGLVKHMKNILAPLNLQKRFVRIGMGGDSQFTPVDKAEKDEYKILVHMAGETKEIPAKSSETILVALEKAGFVPAVKCRSGICGFCRSYIVKGEVTLADTDTAVRKRDKELGYIHPCCTFPMSDLEIIVHRG